MTTADQLPAVHKNLLEAAHLFDEAHTEIEACHAMLVEALSYVDPDHGSGQEFQDRLVAFLEERKLHRPASDSI